MKRITVMLSAVLLMATFGELPAAAAISGKIIPDDAVEYEGHFYKVYDDLADNKKASWDKANKFCKRRGGHLAVITTPEEDEFVADYLSGKGYKSVFFGLHYVDGEWRWINDEPFAYSNWGENNPDGSGGDPYGQYYKLYSLRKWNDAQFDFDGSAYVCEWDSGTKVSETTTDDAENLIEKNKLDKLGDSYYRVFNNSLPYSEAAAFCRNLGGHLAYIDDAKEQAFVNDLISKNGKRNLYWIGAQKEEKRWRWLNGTRISGYTNWSNKKPKNTAENANCAAINSGSENYDVGAWAAEPEQGTISRESEYYINIGFICEWELICKSDEGEFIVHKESDWKIKTEGSCNTGGERYKHCVRCGEVTASEQLSPEPHDFERRGLIGNLNIPGISNFVCIKCGKHNYAIDRKKIWIIPTAIIVYIIFTCAYYHARDDFESKARSQNVSILTKRLPKMLFILTPIAAVLATVLIAIYK
ncbi:MAG: C-type lectin domain-containing protein [Ruminococcus sp.]|nr:C-type lectin domain-containing protein [Ruminococcus sp.]